MWRGAVRWKGPGSMSTPEERAALDASLIQYGIAEINRLFVQAAVVWSNGKPITARRPAGLNTLEERTYSRFSGALSAIWAPGRLSRLTHRFRASDPRRVLERGILAVAQRVYNAMLAADQASVDAGQGLPGFGTRSFHIYYAIRDAFDWHDEAHEPHRVRIRWRLLQEWEGLGGPTRLYEVQRGHDPIEYTVHWFWRVTDEPNSDWLVYRRYVPADVNREFNWASFEAVGSYIGSSATDLETAGRDPRVEVRAQVMDEVRNYYGLEEMDSYPIRYTRRELLARYRDLRASDLEGGH